MRIYFITWFLFVFAVEILLIPFMILCIPIWLVQHPDKGINFFVWRPMLFFDRSNNMKIKILFLRNVTREFTFLKGHRWGKMVYRFDNKMWL